jgi:GDPmannose 4,6-dehydratase
MQKKLYLGNLNALRDWGHAKDYVKAQWLILQQEQPDDYVIATGVQHSVRELAETAFKEIGVEIEWKGKGANEKGIVASVGSSATSCVKARDTVIEIDRRYHRPTEVDTLVGDATKARQKLGWQPKISFQELIAEMVREDIKEAEMEQLCIRAGFTTFNHSE